MVLSEIADLQRVRGYCLILFSDLNELGLLLVFDNCMIELRVSITFLSLIHSGLVTQ